MQLQFAGSILLELFLIEGVCIEESRTVIGVGFYDEIVVDLVVFVEIVGLVCGEGYGFYLAV